MEYSRDSLTKLADKLNLEQEYRDTALDILSEFSRKNKEWKNSHIGKYFK